jgi:uncharacterized Zn finger protein
MMNTAELTALHTATLTAMNDEDRRGRTLTNITRRAETLFADGYTVERSRVNGLFYVSGPQGQEYQVNIGTAIGNHCDCPAFSEYETCKHYQAVDLMLKEAAQSEAADRESEEAEEARSFFDSCYELDYA